MVESRKDKSKGEEHSSLKFHSNLGKKPKMELQGEFKNIKLPTYDGEFEEATKVCILNINIYFQVYYYSTKLKGKLTTYQLQGEASLWWEEMKAMHNLENNVN